MKAKVEIIAYFEETKIYHYQIKKVKVSLNISCWAN